MNYSEMYKWTSVPDFVCKQHYLLCDFWEDNSATVTKGLFNSPIAILLIIAAYIPGVLFIGPALMSKRKPWNVGNFMKWYNYVNILTNSYIFFTVLYYTRWGYDCWFCQDFGEDVPEHTMIFVGFLYTALKVFDLLDTVFFVLRKKYNQITPLHVIHHSIMPLTAYITLKLAVSPAPGLTIILNCFVHMVMYYYYHLASQGYHVWWKKHITQIQLLQFAIVWVHGLHIFFYENCCFPRWLACLELLEATYFLISFSRFYLKAYKNDTCHDLNNNDNKKKVVLEKED